MWVCVFLRSTYAETSTPRLSLARVCRISLLSLQAFYIVNNTKLLSPLIPPYLSHTHSLTPVHNLAVCVMCVCVCVRCVKIRRKVQAYTQCSHMV